jgi:cell division protein FtsL
MKSISRLKNISRATYLTIGIVSVILLLLAGVIYEHMEVVELRNNLSNSQSDIEDLDSKVTDQQDQINNLEEEKENNQ